ncbi:hypothetical protein MTO96_000700 [Rhipicephalus appendiculatus]
MSPLSSEYEEPDRALDERQKPLPTGTGPRLPPRERKNTPAVKPRSPDLAIQSGLHDAAAPKETPASLRADTTRAGTSGQLPEAPSTGVPTSRAPLEVPALEVAAAAKSAGQAKGREVGEMKPRAKPGSPPGEERLGKAKRPMS